MNEASLPVIIVGAGLCGLSAAYHLEAAGCTGYTVLERQPAAGGLASTDSGGGFSFDRCIHLLFTRDQYLLNLLGGGREGEGLKKYSRRSYCYSAGTYTGFPYQQHNYGLPLRVILGNILGLVRARLGAGAGRATNYEEWIYAAFGSGIAENCMLPYSRRLWAWDLKDMAFDWAAGHMPVPKVWDTVLGALLPRKKRFGQTSEFWYPQTGGIGFLANSLLEKIPAEKVSLNASVKAVNGPAREVLLADGRRLRYGTLISTMPLPELIRLIGADVPEPLRAKAAGLKYNTVHTVNIGLEGGLSGLAGSAHWIYFLDDAAIFHRLGFPCNFSKWLAPEGCCSIQAEISESERLPRNRETLIADTLRDLVKTGILREKDILPVSGGGRVKYAKLSTYAPAYVICDHGRAETVAVLKEFLGKYDIETRGRFGEWEYLNMDRVIMRGKDAAETVIKRRALAGGRGKNI